MLYVYTASAILNQVRRDSRFTTGKLHIEFDETSMVQMACRILKEVASLKKTNGSMHGTFPLMASCLWFSLNLVLLISSSNEFGHAKKADICVDTQHHNPR